MSGKNPIWRYGVPLGSGAPPPWEDPTDEAGLLLWLNETSITSAAGSVSAWANLSGQGNDFAQATAELQPAEVTLNSLAAVQGNGTNQLLVAASDVAAAGAFEVLLAAALPAAAAAFFASSLDGAAGLRLDGFRRFVVRAGGNQANATGSGVMPADSAPTVISVSRSAANALRVEVNGVNVTSAGPPTVAGAFGLGEICGATVLASFSALIFGEVIVYDHQLSTGVRADATAYLTAKWL